MLDPRYILMQDLQEYFVDKDTGLPLGGGIVTFYSDVNRTTKKNIYQITGSPPNYNYAPLPNPMTLSSVGTPQDGSGNDIAVYYFPFDADGNPELYYITCVSSGSVSQFTREAWPNFIETGTSGEAIVNYVPNGQFTVHTNVPPTDTTVAGQITGTVTYLAQGGWTFERPSMSTATDIVTFTRFGSYVSIPPANPRYAININTTVPNAGDTFKDLRLKFRNVNTFASDTQYYTLYFNGQTNSGNSTVININIIKNFGSGGSSTTTTNVETITIPASYTSFNIPILFDNNTGKTIGTNDDDYVQIAFSFPVNSVFNISLVDIALTIGDVEVTSFPQETYANVLAQTIGGWLTVPDYNSMNVYLPMVLTPQGATFDTSEVGMIKAILNTTPPISYLNADSAQYEVNAYSSDLIPYRRLFNYLFNNTTLISKCGNGALFVNAYQTGSTTHFRLTANTVGSVTNSSDGTAPTGFTFSNITSGQTAALFYTGISGNSSNTQVIFINRANGLNTSINAGTSGFSGASTLVFGTAAIPQVEAITTTTSSGLASEYFTISNPSANYYFWWKVDGSGSDPAPGGTGIEMDIFSVYSANDVARVIAETANGFHIDDIQTVAASAMTGGCYFNFYTHAGLHYYCYYIIGGVGNDPLVSGAIGIPVSISGSATAAQVLTATVTAINSKFFAVPDFRGMFLRGHNGSATFIQDSLLRISLLNSSVSGDITTTLQYNENVSHIHGATTTLSNGNGIYNGGATLDSSSGARLGIGITASTTIGPSGGTESRPYNQQVNWVIKY